VKGQVTAPRASQGQPKRAKTPHNTDLSLLAPLHTTAPRPATTKQSMSKQATVVEQKQLFLQSRKQLLSRGIPPSERLRTIAEDGGIELSVLKGVLGA
jgi:hypothetical protein